MTFNLVRPHLRSCFKLGRITKKLQDAVPSIGFKNQNFYRYSSKDCEPKTALVILANGVEESEAAIAIDVLRRVGVCVTVAGLCGKNPIRTMQSVNIVTDEELKAVEDKLYNMVVLPGGYDSTMAIAESELAGEVLRNHEKCCRIIAAICAAPLALHKHGIMYDRKLTSYPALKEKLEKHYKYKDDKVVMDENLITSRGPGTSFEFALKLAQVLAGKDKVKEVANAMLLPFHPY